MYYISTSSSKPPNPPEYPCSDLVIASIKIAIETASRFKYLRSESICMVNMNIEGLIENNREITYELLKFYTQLYNLLREYDKFITIIYDELSGVNKKKTGYEEEQKINYMRIFFNQFLNESYINKITYDEYIEREKSRITSLIDMMDDIYSRLRRKKN